MLALMDFYGADVGQFTSAAMFFCFLFVCLFVLAEFYLELQFLVFFVFFVFCFFSQLIA